MSALIVAGTSVRVDPAGRYNLNDLHHAGGGKPKHRPSLWLANQQTRALVDELDSEAGIPALAIQRGGATSGSYGCRELALAYAAWIAPAFHVRVLRAADAVLRGQVQPEQPLQAALRDPHTLRALLVDQVDERLKLEAQVAELAPAAAALERLEGAKGSYSLRESAKLLGIGEHSLIQWLLEHRWIYRERERNRIQALAQALKAGLLLHSPVVINHPNGDMTMTFQTKVSGKGIARLAKALNSNKNLLVAPKPSFQH